MGVKHRASRDASPSSFLSGCESTKNGPRSSQWFCASEAMSRLRRRVAGERVVCQPPDSGQKWRCGTAAPGFACRPGAGGGGGKGHATLGSHSVSVWCRQPALQGQTQQPPRSQNLSARWSPHRPCTPPAQVTGGPSPGAGIPVSVRRLRSPIPVVSALTC